MFDLADELDAVRRALSEAKIEYALCGGMAMGLHGKPRTTEDIDILIRDSDLERVEAAVGKLGFTVKAKPMNFSGGAMRIRRISKIDRTDGDTIMLDLLLSSPQTQLAWDTRQVKIWRNAPLSVVSIEGLILLKEFRSSKQDLADIAKLRGEE